MWTEPNAWEVRAESNLAVIIAGRGPRLNVLNIQASPYASEPTVLSLLFSSAMSTSSRRACMTSGAYSPCISAIGTGMSGGLTPGTNIRTGLRKWRTSSSLVLKTCLSLTLRTSFSPEEMRPGYSALREMHGFGYSMLPLRPDEEGSWEHLVNRSGARSLSVGCCEW